MTGSYDEEDLDDYKGKDDRGPPSKNGVGASDRERDRERERSPPRRRERSRRRSSRSYSRSPDRDRRYRSRSRSPRSSRYRSRSYSRSPPRGGRYREDRYHGGPPPPSHYRDYPPDRGPPPRYGYDDKRGPFPPGYRDYPPRPHGPPPPGHRGGGGGASRPRGEGRRDEGPPGVSLLVRNVAPDVTSQDLQQAFGRIGEIRDVYIPRDYHSHQPRGFAFIEYATAPMAADARDEMDGYMVKGRELEVVFAQERRKTPGEMRGRVVNQDNRFERSSSFERAKQGGRGGGSREAEDAADAGGKKDEN